VLTCFGYSYCVLSSSSFIPLSCPSSRSLRHPSYFRENCPGPQLLNGGGGITIPFCSKSFKFTEMILSPSLNSTANNFHSSPRPKFKYNFHSRVLPFRVSYLCAWFPDSIPRLPQTPNPKVSVSAGLPLTYSSGFPFIGFCDQGETANNAETSLSHNLNWIVSELCPSFLFP